jgi:DNA mismatch repair protein MutS2
MAIGIPGKSNAFAIARRLGLDETILAEAMALTGVGGNESEALLDAIYELRDKMAAEEAASRLALRDIEEDRDALARRLEQIEEERQQVLAAAQAEAKTKIEAIEEELRKARQSIRDAQSLNKLKQVSKDVEKVGTADVAAIAPPRPKERKPTRNTLDWQVGDQVLVKALNTQGEIVSLSKYEAQVAIGQMQMRVKLRDLEWKDRPEAEPEPEYVRTGGGPAPGLELDIRGRRVEDGLAEVNAFLDRAALARMPWVRIIHGKGTGRLKHAIRHSLQGNPQVLSWEDGRDGEGGDGVTVVKFAED